MKHVKPGHTHPVVCLDAGHSGDYNRSPAVPEYYESDMSWTLHLLLKTALERYGIVVKTTRATQDTMLGVYERGAASKGCDLFLSLHSNAVGSDVNDTVDRVMVYVPLDGSGDEIGRLLADQISLIMGTQQKGRIATREGSNGDYYGVIRGAVAVGTVGLILEHSFHTNTQSTHWLMKEANLARLAEEEAVVIAEYFDVPAPDTPVEHGVLYRVQAGAFRVRTNAEEHLTKVKSAGFDAYITSSNENDTLYRIQTGAFRVKGNAEAYLSEVKAAGLDAYITTQAINEPSSEPESYTLKQFILDVQTAVGAAVDGIAGPETLSKVPTISRLVNSTHPAVIPVQKRLYTLGYTQVGNADGIAGSGFEHAVKAFQADNNGEADGEITAGEQTWRKLLELK
ncbi:MAG: N-acetylmuramoyl-L-alanine amidase [Oscillospiraceae bacterium]|nr:N-acetylmuramoyl-L-alanine amidase [Oscillospiraceae bacterium]